MLRRFETAEVAESLDLVFERLRQCECHVVPVTHRGVLAGLLTMENVAEFLLVQAALRSPATTLARAA